MDRLDGSTDKLPARVIVAATIGNFVEWYDLAIYAYAAAAIGKTFFANADTGTQLIVSFAVFALTYLVRPISGLVIGVIGDRVGRKHLLVFTILIMGVATTAIGLLPGSAYWGPLAPLLLLVLRVMQGIGAAGEFMGAATFVVEHSPASKRGLAMGLIQLGTGLCYPVAFGAAATLIYFGGADWFNEGGWRILFLISAPLTLVSLYLRNNVQETPVFQALKSRNLVSRRPIREVFTLHWKALVSCFLFMFAFGTTGILVVFYLPNRVADIAGVSGRSVAVACLLLYALSIPVWGYLLDRVSRGAARFIYCLGGVVLPVPCLTLIESGNLVALAFGYGLLAVWVGLCFSLMYVTLVELFPPRVRFTSTALVDNLLKAIVAGTTVLVSLLLIRETGSQLAPAFYGTGAGFVSIVGAVLLSQLTASHLSSRDDFETALNTASPRQTI